MTDQQDDPRQAVRERSRRNMMRALNRQPPGPDDDPIALDDVRLSRRDGQLEPLKVKTMMNAHVIEFRPISYGAKVRLSLYDRDVMALDDEEKLALLQEHMVQPSFEDVTVDELRQEFDWMFVDDLCLTIVKESRSRFRAALPEVRETESGKADGSETESDEA